MSSPNRTGVREYATKRIRLGFSFRTDADNNPDAIRQEKGTYVTSVVRTAAGRYTVQLAGMIPRQLTYALVAQHNADESPTSATLPSLGYVKNLAVDTTLKQIEVCVMVANGAGAPGVGLPEDNTWVSVVIEGPETSTRADAA